MIFAFDAACGTCGRALKNVHVKLPLKGSSQSTITRSSHRSSTRRRLGMVDRLHKNHGKGSFWRGRGMLRESATLRPTRDLVPKSKNPAASGQANGAGGTENVVEGVAYRGRIEAATALSPPSQLDALA